MSAPQVQDAPEIEMGAEVPQSVALMRTQRVADLASPSEVASFIRQRDDEQIMASIMGEVLDAWFYEFKVQGKTVEGVSIVGATEFARIRGEQGFPIRFPVHEIKLEETTENGEPGVRCTLIARDVRTGGDGLGMAFYPYFAARRDGTRVFDDKASRKALSVAQRNAILDLVPEALIKTMLKERKALIAANEARRADEAKALIEERRRNAPKIAGQIASRAQADANTRDEYEEHATKGQLDRLLELMRDARMSKKGRDTIDQAIGGGLTASAARALIAEAERVIEKRSATKEETSGAESGAAAESNQTVAGGDQATPAPTAAHPASSAESPAVDMLSARVVAEIRELLKHASIGAELRVGIERQLAGGLTPTQLAATKQMLTEEIGAVKKAASAKNNAAHNTINSPNIERDEIPF